MWFPSVDLTLSLRRHVWALIGYMVAWRIICEWELLETITTFTQLAIVYFYFLCDILLCPQSYCFKLETAFASWCIRCFFCVMDRVYIVLGRMNNLRTLHCWWDYHTNIHDKFSSVNNVDNYSRRNILIYLKSVCYFSFKCISFVKR